MVEVTEADRLALREYLAERARRSFAGRIEPHADLLLETLACHRIAAENAAQQEITALRARIAEDQAQIAALTTYRDNLRDEVIELRARIAELEAERAEWVEVERLRMGKPTPPTPPA